MLTEFCSSDFCGVEVFTVFLSSPPEMSLPVSEPMLITSFIQLSHSTEHLNELLLYNTGPQPHVPAHFQLWVRQRRMFTSEMIFKTFFVFLSVIKVVFRKSSVSTAPFLCCFVQFTFPGVVQAGLTSRLGTQQPDGQFRETNFFPIHHLI